MMRRNFRIAVEAPVDITESTEQEMQEIENQMNEEVPEEEEATEEEPPAEETEEAPEEEPAEEEEPPEETEETGEEEEPPTEEEEEVPEEEEPIEPDESQLDYERRLKVHQNTLRFLSIITSNRESFEQRFSKSISVQEIKEYHTILKAFDDLIEMTQNILCTKFMKGSYATLVKYYVALNRVYDLITRMTKAFVTSHMDEKIKLKSK